jgi:hypothetical protein
MSKPFTSNREDPPKGLDLARVLLKHADLASRLALQTILRAGGYDVDAAATPSEALCKLDEGKYDLVLSDGRNVLSYAKVKDYRPATALITSSQPKSDSRMWRHDQLSVYTENLPTLLGDVAELIGIRASRRYRPLRDM